MTNFFNQQAFTALVWSSVNRSAILSTLLGKLLLERSNALERLQELEQGEQECNCWICQGRRGAERQMVKESIAKLDSDIEDCRIELDASNSMLKQDVHQLQSAATEAEGE